MNDLAMYFQTSGEPTVEKKEEGTKIVSDNKPQILTEGRAISGGVSPKPTINKPFVKPAGQGTINPQNKGKD